MLQSGGRTADRPAGGARRLGADDWLGAGLDILVEDGIAGVKVHRLCARLGVTKGSFYWHFTDLDSFLTELAERWALEGAPLAGTVDEDADPDAQLLAAMRLFADPRNRNLARAMREWAQSDPRARAAIHRADEALFARVTEAMRRCGFDDEEAEVRAKILYYSGVGYAHVGELGRPLSAERQLTKTWEILTRP
jgi:AcrR family transcriptional regulator